MGNMYAAATVRVILSSNISALLGSDAGLVARIVSEARDAIRKDWASVNMQTRLHADLIVADEIGFVFYGTNRGPEYVVVRCTDDNVVTLLTCDEAAQ